MKALLQDGLQAHMPAPPEKRLLINHRNRWTVYGGVDYITIPATHYLGSHARVTISDKMYIDAFGSERSYVLDRIWFAGSAIVMR